jgi:hypothetical protein
MKTIAKQLKIKEFPFEIKDSNGKLIYREESDGGYWAKSEYDSKGNRIYFENSDGFWIKREYDSNGKMIYWENSDGTVIDDRPKTDVQKAIELLTKEGLIVDGKILKN